MNEERDLQIKKRIMRRVYAVYLTRSVFSLKGAKIFALVLFICELLPFSHAVSLRNIYANMPHATHLKALYEFGVSAVYNTELLVQIYLLAVLLVIVSSAFGFLRRTAGKLFHLNLAGQPIAR